LQRRRLAISLFPRACASENRLKIYGNSLLLESGQQVNGDSAVFAAKHWQFIGKFHDETKPRPFRTYQDHYPILLAGWIPSVPDADRFLPRSCADTLDHAFARPDTLVQLLGMWSEPISAVAAKIINYTKALPELPGFSVSRILR